MSDTNITILTNILLPLLVTGLFNFGLFWMQAKRDAPKTKVDVSAGLEELCANLTEQLREAQKLIQELRAGIAVLLRQFRRMETEPEWRPNGHDTEE